MGSRLIDCCGLEKVDDGTRETRLLAFLPSFPLWATPSFTILFPPSPGTLSNLKGPILLLNGS